MTLEAQRNDARLRRHNQLIESRDRIKEELEAVILTGESLTDLMQFAETVTEGLNDPTFEQKRRYLKVKEVHAHYHCQQPDRGPARGARQA